MAVPRSPSDQIVPRFAGRRRGGAQSSARCGPCSSVHGDDSRADVDALQSSVRSVSAAPSWASVTGRADQLLSETGRPEKASRGHGQLGLSPTPRQLEVLLARCETGSRKSAARLLGIRTKTVHWHFARLFDRCGCVDEAMAAFRHSDELERLRAAGGRGTIWRVFLPPPTITGTMEK